jgi:hypothetical protein
MLPERKAFNRELGEQVFPKRIDRARNRKGTLADGDYSIEQGQLREEIVRVLLPSPFDF